MSAGDGISAISRRTRPLLILMGALGALLVVSALLYQLGMAHLEGTPRDFWTALEWAGETLTTTGYGKDSGWTHPVMVVFVIAVQFAGVLLVFLLLPIVLLPFLEQRFEVRLPRTVEKLDDPALVKQAALLLEQENARLKKLVAERDLEIEVMKEVAAKKW